MFNHPRVATEKQRSPMNLDEFFMNRFAVRPSLSLPEPLREFTPRSVFSGQCLPLWKWYFFKRWNESPSCRDGTRRLHACVLHYVNRKRIFKQDMFVRSKDPYIHRDQDYSTLFSSTDSRQYSRLECLLHEVIQVWSGNFNNNSKIKLLQKLKLLKLIFLLMVPWFTLYDSIIC